MQDSRGHRFLIVRAGECFEDWGVVEGQKCQTCPCQCTRCRHVLKNQGADEGGEAAEWLSTEAFERKINKVTLALALGLVLSLSLTCRHALHFLSMLV